MQDKKKNKLKIIEWDHVKHFNGTLERKEIETVAVMLSDTARYYISVVDDCIQIHKTGFNNDQLSVMPLSSNTISIK